MRTALPIDTEAAIYDRQVETWMALSWAERVRLIEQMCADIETLARIGIQRANPDATEHDVRFELAYRR